MPEKPQPLVRNISGERSFTREAAGLHDATPIIAHSEQRSVEAHGNYTPNIMEIAPGRDLVQDALEEIADARLYICFIAREREGDPWWHEKCRFALQHLVQAYNALTVEEDD